MMKGCSQMSRKMMSNSNLKPVCSVIEIIRMLELSRARFYQLQEQGIFPPPIYDIKTHRPFYTLELQQACLTVRESNIGFNGQYILFYSPRKNSAAAKVPKRSASADEPLSEITETLKRMGIDVDGQIVKKAMDELYPNGTDGTGNQGVIIRDLFRYFKNGASK
jgi:hypothetical protein